MRYDSAFTFIYSPRRGTDAAVMADQVPEEVKHERLERLVDVVQRIAAERNADRVGAGRGGARRGPVAHGLLAPARPHAHGTRRSNFTGTAQPGELVDVLVEGATSTTLRGRIAAAVAA